MTFDARVRRSPGVPLGIDCVHVRSSKVCGLLIKSINEEGVVAAWNVQSTEPLVFHPGDWVVKVNGVDGNESGVKALAAALRAAGEIVHISVWGARKSEPVQVQCSEFISERIRWLSERSRVCSRAEWESTWIPHLPQNSRTATIAASGDCSVCMESIPMDAQVRGLSCGHYFHLECVAEWFMRDQSFELCCPMCRLALAEQQSRWVSL